MGAEAEVFMKILKLAMENSDKLGDAFRVGAALPEISKEKVAMPNIPTPTMGGKVFWETLAEYNGWKLQQNMFTHHARILNSDNVRVAWGTLEGMQKSLDNLTLSKEKYSNIEKGNSTEAVNKLKQLKELLDSNIITEEEYNEKKRQLLKII